MSYYTVISKSENIKLLKKENKFKLEAQSIVDKRCDILKLMKKGLFFDLLKKVSPKIIKEVVSEKINDDKRDIHLIFKELDEDDEEKLYMSFTQKIKQLEDGSVLIIGKKTDENIDNFALKKIEIDNLLINISFNNNELNITMKVLYIGERLPVFSDNMIGHMFDKIFKNVINYYT